LERVNPAMPRTKTRAGEEDTTRGKGEATQPVAVRRRARAQPLSYARGCRGCIEAIFVILAR
jgi:hypothetical protein